MKNVKLCADGSMESTDGKILLKAYPIEPPEKPVAERLLDGKMVRKAGRETRKDEDGIAVNTITIKDHQIHYSVGSHDEARRVTLHSDPIPGTASGDTDLLKCWPPTHEIVERARRKEFEHSTTFGVEVLKRALDALARAGVENIRFDFDASYNGARDMTRFSGKTKDTYIVGVIMPVSTHRLESPWEATRQR
jgi:hypothetical protein